MHRLIYLSLWLALAFAPVAHAERQNAPAAGGFAAVNVNKATIQQLAQHLDGVGLNKAKAIVEYRQKFGPFQNMADLREVSGIGPALVSANKARIKFK